MASGGSFATGYAPSHEGHEWVHLQCNREVVVGVHISAQVRFLWSEVLSIAQISQYSVWINIIMVL